MACMECPNCGWMGNEAKCPECGSYCIWDEELQRFDRYTDSDEEEDDDEQG